MLCVSALYCQPFTTSLGAGTPFTVTEMVDGSGFKERGKMRRSVLMAWAILTRVFSKEASQSSPPRRPSWPTPAGGRLTGEAAVVDVPPGKQPLGVVPPMVANETRFSFPLPLTPEEARVVGRASV